MTARWHPEDGTDPRTPDEHIGHARAEFRALAARLVRDGTPAEAIWAGAVAAALDSASGEHDNRRLAHMLYTSSLFAAKQGGIEPATPKH